MTVHSQTDAANEAQGVFNVLNGTEEQIADAYSILGAMLNTKEGRRLNHMRGDRNEGPIIVDISCSECEKREVVGYVGTDGVVHVPMKLRKPDIYLTWFGDYVVTEDPRPTSAHEVFGHAMGNLGNADHKEVSRITNRIMKEIDDGFREEDPAYACRRFGC
jgi:hypothetical protein